MQVWNLLHAGRCKCRTQKSPKNRYLGTITQLCQAISSQLRHVSTIGKKLLSSNISSTCPQNMVNFGTLAAEIVSLVWGTPGNFNGFRVLVALLHGTLVVGVSQTLRRWTEGATYIRQGGHHVGHWPTFLVLLLLIVVTIRLHRNITYADAAYCYRPSSVVRRSVCRSRFSCEGAVLRGRTAHRDALPRPVQKRLNRSRSRLGFGLGWAQGSTY